MIDLKACKEFFVGNPRASFFRVRESDIFYSRKFRESWILSKEV